MPIQIVNVFPVHTTAQRQMSQVLGPYDVHAKLAHVIVIRRASWQVQFFKLVECAHRFCEGLVGDRFGDEGEVQVAQVRAFAERGPAIDCEASLRSNELFERGFCAAEQAGGHGLAALVDNVAEIKHFD